MPLPKTATIAARATEVYCEVWSVILQRFCKMPPVRTSDLKELSQLLPYLRQLLTCCACAGLLDNAMVSLTCGHCYCFDCQFREPLLKIHCRQCRERTGLVIERQLQLVVNCYKSMCHILGEELRKDSSAFASGMKSEPNNQGSVHHLKKDPDALQSENEATQEKKQGSKIDLKVPDDKVRVVSTGPTVDPIAEIVREVEKGTKVSRAIFIIKPPSKYVNTKVALAPKKEPAANISATSVQTNMSSAPICKDEPKECTSESSVKSNGAAKDVIKQEIEKALDSGSVKPAKQPKKRTHRKSGLSEKLYKAPTIKATTISDAPDLATPSTLAPTTKPRRNRLSLSSLKLNSHRGHSHARKRRKALSTVSSTLPLNLELGEEEVKVGSSGSDADIEKSEQVHCRTRTSFRTTSQLAELDSTSKFVHGQVRVEDLSVCIGCLDERYLNITPDTIGLLPQEQLSHRLKEALNSSARDTGPEYKRFMFTREQWKKATRKRAWGPFCRSVMVKRCGEDIAKMIALQTNTAKAKRKMRQKLKPAVTEENKHHPLAIPSPIPLSSLPPPPRPLPSRSPRRSLPTPPIPSQPVTSNDIPIPEHISILSGDGRDNINDADINWTEFSNFFESSEESIPALSTLGCYPSSQHHQPPPPPPHDPELGPIHFREFDSHLMMQQHHHHRPCLPPPPPLPRPSHLSPLPHHHSPHPPMMPYSPMLGPDLPPHETFYSPMNPGGIRPDLGGYSSPMTPRRNFPVDPCLEGLYHQRSPNHGGGNFQFPHSGGGFSPVGRFPRPTPPTTPMMVQKKKNNSMSEMVGKMKIKSPTTTPKNLLTTPPAQGKKRRSPGYSETGWRCRCGTNKIMFPDKVCAKGKCPCYAKGSACKNCLCRYCHNPFGPREQAGTASPVATEATDQ